MDEKTGVKGKEFITETEEAARKRREEFLKNLKDPDAAYYNGLGGWDKRAVCMAKGTLVNALKILSSKECRKTGEYRTDDKGTMLEILTGGRPHKRKDLIYAVKANARLLYDTHQLRFLERMEKEYNVILDPEATDAVRIRGREGRA